MVTPAFATWRAPTGCRLYPAGVHLHRTAGGSTSSSCQLSTVQLSIKVLNSGELAPTVTWAPKRSAHCASARHGTDLLSSPKSSCRSTRFTRLAGFEGDEHARAANPVFVGAQAEGLRVQQASPMGWQGSVQMIRVKTNSPFVRSSTVAMLTKPTFGRRTASAPEWTGATRKRSAKSTCRRPASKQEALVLGQVSSRFQRGQLRGSRHPRGEFLGFRSPWR